MRFTPKVVQQLLNQNEGFEKNTSYSDRNFSEDRKYVITNGELRYRSSSKTSWADSRRNAPFVTADKDQTLRFLRKNLHNLNIDGIE